LAIVEPGREPRRLDGRLTIHKRDFPVQRLTLPQAMVDLDPETERRAVSEGERLRTLYHTITPERLWRGRFARPGGGTEPATRVGARRRPRRRRGGGACAGRGAGTGPAPGAAPRRIINGKPRAPHSGGDYAAD